MEIGPYRVKTTSDGQHLEYNDGSWDEFSNLMFVDNPTGTGFSYADTDSYLHELTDMASQFVVFLENWFKLFPQFEQDDVSLIPIFISYFYLQVKAKLNLIYIRYILPASPLLDSIFHILPKPY